MRKALSLLLILTTVVILSNCKKADPPDLPVFTITLSDTPSITLNNVTPIIVTQFEDEITFTISYEDGNGDLGHENADSMTIWLIDNRNTDELIQKFHLAPITPAGQEIAVRGVLNINLDHTAILDNNNTQETTTYTIKIKDRAGNWSNEVTSGTITINE
ncbi:MAG: hypothetical protein IH946_10490 [Bacteroidetes bacterium]|nr:hypothetical protein [Bacteroidota bacterium]